MKHYKASGQKQDRAKCKKCGGSGFITTCKKGGFFTYPKSYGEVGRIGENKKIPCPYCEIRKMNAPKNNKPKKSFN